MATPLEIAADLARRLNWGAMPQELEKELMSLLRLGRYEEFTTLAENPQAFRQLATPRPRGEIARTGSPVQATGSHTYGQPPKTRYRRGQIFEADTTPLTAKGADGPPKKPGDGQSKAADSSEGKTPPTVTWKKRAAQLGGGAAAYVAAKKILDQFSDTADEDVEEVARRLQEGDGDVPAAIQRAFDRAARPAPGRAYPR